MLAHRKQAGRVSGRVTLDGQPTTRERMLRCSAYVLSTLLRAISLARATLTLLHHSARR